MIEILPWHSDAWSRLSGSAATLHHGLILSGVSGVGKREFSIALAQRLLCSNPHDQLPCGDCQDCKLFNAGTHPDFHVITSEYEASEGRIELVSRYCDRYQDSVARGKKVNPSQVIPVDQIRTLIERFYQSSHISESRVALILPADRMNANAANALLKLLEEPPSGAFFLLVTDQPGLLPSTIRSRCVMEPLSSPTPEQAKDWLYSQLKGVVPNMLLNAAPVGPIDILAAYQTGVFQQQQEHTAQITLLLGGQSDPIELAALLAKQDAVLLLTWMHRILAELLKWQGAGQKPAWVGDSNLDIGRYSPAKLFRLYDKLGRYRLIARDQINLQLALEEILISFQQTFRTYG